MLDLWSQLSAWVLPRVCVCCHFNSEELYIDLCVWCKGNLPWLRDCCYQCGLPLDHIKESIFCDKCQNHPPAYDRLCALFSYKPPISNLVNKLKFGGILYHGPMFASLLAEAIQQRWYVDQPLPQAIIPVPLHLKRLRKRGYNQAVEIAQPLAKMLRLPLDVTTCIRIINTRQQTRLSKELRQQNLTRAFLAENARHYSHVALLDDVVTTGSTVRAVSNALLDVGVENIDVWCVCRA